MLGICFMGCVICLFVGSLKLGECNFRAFWACLFIMLLCIGIFVYNLGIPPNKKYATYKIHSVDGYILNSPKTVKVIWLQRNWEFDDYEYYILVEDDEIRITSNCISSRPRNLEWEDLE